MNTLPNPDRELAERFNDGLEVKLYWIPPTILTYVTVADHKNGTYSRIDTPDGASPNDVFNHPFAYQTEEQPTIEFEPVRQMVIEDEEDGDIS
jgi:hypothetical protein